MIKPKALQPGDTVAVITLSAGLAGAYPHRYEAGKRQLQQEFGLTVVETKHALKDPDWIARHPEARAEDLMEAFADDRIKGIFTIIGGDDSVRILPFLDLSVIKHNPKIFLGFSDTTVSHFACFKAGLTSFYGPTIMAGFAENGGMFPYMVQSVRRTLFSSEPVGIVEPNRDGWTDERLDWAEPRNQHVKRKRNPPTGWRFLQGSGVVRGKLIGGCLDALEFLKGTEFWPAPDQWQGAVFFIETSEEAPEPVMVKRWLRNYGTQGILQQLSAMIVGRPGGSIPEADFVKYDEAILEVVTEELGLDSLPVVTNMDFGHTDPMFVIPYGVEAEIDCERQTFAITENAVT